MMTTRASCSTAPRLPSGWAMPPPNLLRSTGSSRHASILGQDRCGRDNGPRAGSRTRADEDRLLLGDSPRRPALARPEPPGVAYTYAPGRGAVHALKLLDNYTGVVQCDGYAAYKTLTNPGRKDNCAETITLAFCWSHLRRRFVEIERTSPAPAAKEALVRIGQLYTIERALRGRTAKERRQGRQAQAKPLVTALKTWFEERLKTLSAKSPTAEAIRYGLNHWDGLIRFLDDGRIELDTNAVERAMRPIALTGRTPCSPVAMKVPRLGHVSLRSSRAAASTA